MPDNPASESPGGWRKPTTPGSWRAPDQPVKEVGWRVPALPTDLPAEPTDTGEWHLPQPEDTVFTSEDKTEIKRPEDALLDNLPAEAETFTPEAQAPEDMAFSEEPFAVPAPEDFTLDDPAAIAAGASEDDADEAPLAPEDLIYMIEHDDSDDYDTVGMSELVALASLAEQDFETEVMPITSELDDTTDTEDELSPEMLSPAERVLLQGKPSETLEDDQAATDAAEYARQQLAQLSGTGDPAADVTEGDQAVSDATDAAEYARQQLAQLQGNAPVIPGTPALNVTGQADPASYARDQLQELQEDGTDAAPQPTLDPRQQELLRKFEATEEQVRVLRQQAQSGAIAQETFLNELRNHMILDDDQTWWMMGVETDTWYKSEDGQWVEAVPQVLALTRSQQPTNPSLAFLPDSPTTMTEATAPISEFTPAQEGLRVDENYMPLPADVPIVDPEATVPSAGLFNRDTDVDSPYAQPTIPSPSFSEPTVRAEPVEYGSMPTVQYGGADAAYDQAQPQEDIYQEAVKKQNTSLTRILILGAVAMFVLILLAGAGFIAAALLWYNGIVDDWQAGINALNNYQPEFQTVTVLDRNGQQIATLAREGNDRRPVDDLSQISPYMIHAIISLENERYYDDPGWDFFAIIRAFYQNFVSGDIESGASTLTQQVARNLVLQSTEVTAERKLNEIIVAGELTRTYDKNFILRMYLNEVAFFGNQTYGIEAAARFYFNKSAADLNLPESAMLAAIIQSPANNEPVQNKNTAIALMRVVMDRMAEVGCLQFQHAPYLDQPFCVDPALIQSPQSAPQIALVEAKTYLPREYSVRYPHFTQLVQARLENLLGATDLYRGGYTVTTTLDSALQDAAQTALEDGVKQHQIRGVQTGSVMITDPRNGAVLALIGSADFTSDSGQIDYNRTYQQPGSSIKPLVYAAALSGVDLNGNGISIEQGEYYTPASILWDVETNYANGYTPVNYDGRYHGPVALRFALQNSYNVPAIKTYEFITAGGTQPDNFRLFAEQMGIRWADEAQFNITTAIGSTEVRLIDMMAAYGTIANDGQRWPLTVIQNVADANGNGVALPQDEQPIQVLSPQVAYLLQNILSDNQARAEQFGTRSALYLDGAPVGAKTGTTDGGRDLWTMGFSKNRVVGVWMGTVNNEETVDTLGSSVAAPVWNTVMRAALQGVEVPQFRPPSGVISRQICADTGTIPSNTCANIRNEFFSTDLPPPAADQGFSVTLQIDSWSGLRANDFCPDNVIQETFVNINDPFAVQWLNTAGANYAQRVGLNPPVQQAPQFSCDQNTVLPVVRMSSPGGGQTVQGNFPVTGQVSAQDFDRYQIEVAPATDPGNFQIVGGPFTTQQSTAGSTLGSWETRGVTNGDYVVRLAVFSTAGGYVYRTANITVNNPLPTATPVPALPSATPFVPPSPLPFDNVTAVPQGGPTPTVDPFG